MKLPELPGRIKALPVDERGYPVPWFVAWIDGKPDFRVVQGGKFAEAVRFKKCWVCGDYLGRNVSFVIGPMCAVNRTSGEPPCHRECAIFAAMACPFLTKPRMRRNEKGMDELEERGAEASPYGLRRNPGAAGVWNCRDFQVFRDPEGRPLIHMGDPTDVQWFCEGRAATREEVESSIDSGIGLLHEFCEHEKPDRREAAHKQLDQQVADTKRLFLPAAAPDIDPPEVR